MELLDKLRYDRDGVVPAVIQDIDNDEVLMVGFMNREALAMTISSGLVHFWRRSSRRLWLRGETSGHYQRVRSIVVDCYGESLLIKVDQLVAACHAGYRSCFYREVSADGSSLRNIGRKVFDPTPETTTGERS